MKNKNGQKGQNPAPKQVERTVKQSEPKSGLETKLNEALGASQEPEKVILPEAQEGAAIEPENAQGAQEGGEAGNSDAAATEAPITESKPSKLGEPRIVRNLKQGDTFRYKSSSAKWECTSASEDGSVIEMAKEGGKTWKVTKARELDQTVYMLGTKPAATEAPAAEPAIEPEGDASEHTAEPADNQDAAV